MNKGNWLPPFGCGYSGRAVISSNNKIVDSVLNKFSKHPPKGSAGVGHAK